MAAFAVDSQQAEYVGGTASLPQKTEGTFQTAEKEARFAYKGGELTIDYAKVTSLEYGQKAGRRVGLAIATMSPVALFSKKRKHYLTIGYSDAKDVKQGVVFELGKDIVRPVLTSLEARTGKKVEYESEEAKKHVGN